MKGSIYEETSKNKVGCIYRAVERIDSFSSWIMHLCVCIWPDIRYISSVVFGCLIYALIELKRALCMCVNKLSFFFSNVSSLIHTRIKYAFTEYSEFDLWEN